MALELDTPPVETPPAAEVPAAPVPAAAAAADLAPAELADAGDGAELADDAPSSPRRRRQARNRKRAAEAADSRRDRYLRERIKAAKSPEERAAYEAKLAELKGVGAVPAAAAAPAETPAAEPPPSSAAAWEDPNRPGWPKPELIAKKRAIVLGVLGTLAPALDDTPISLMPRELQGPDGATVTFKPLPAIAEPLAAMWAKRSKPTPDTPEAAFVEAIGLWLAPAAIAWGQVKVAEIMANAKIEAAKAHAAAEIARTERVTAEARVLELRSKGNG